MRMRWMYISLLVVASALFALGDGIPVNGPSDPQVSIGGGRDAVPITSLNFTFFTDSGTTGYFGGDCSLGTLDNNVAVPNCAFENDTGMTILSMSLGIPETLQGAVANGQEVVSCLTQLQLNGSDTAFDDCYVTPTAVVFDTVNDDGNDADDLGLLPGQTFQISLDPWPTNTLLSITSTPAVPEPPTGELLATGLLLAGAAWSWRRRAAVIAR